MHRHAIVTLVVACHPASPPRDGITARVYALGAALRPAVVTALASGDLNAVLVAACDAWRSR